MPGPPLIPSPPMTGPSVGPDAPGLLQAATRALAGETGPAIVTTPNMSDEKLQTLFKSLKEEAWDNRFIYERGWWRILLYLLGRQWIYYDVTRGQWADKRMAKWIPRPVTNKILETLDAYASVFQSVQLVTRARPNGTAPENVTTAETADKLEPAVRDEHDMELMQQESDFWFVATGNVFWHVWWNKGGGVGNQLIPFERCQACQQVSGPDEIEDANNTCPTCGAQTFAPALDPTGAPIGMNAGPGCGVTDILSPFEVAVPPGYGAFKDVSHLFRCRWRTKQYCEAAYGDLVKNFRFDKMPTERSLQLLRALATTADAGSAPLSYATSGTVSTLGEGTAEYELWLKPNRDYPDGLFLRVLGDAQPTIIHKTDEGLPGPLPYKDIKGNPIWPWVHMGYEHMGGRIWARSPLETLLPKQDQINQLDSLVQLIIQRTANPVWLEPKGSEVKKFTGEPGLVVKYNPLIAAGNAKPERIPGENIPATLMALRQSYIQDFENLAGTSDVLKGQRPPNIEAFSALQLLVERSQSRFAPALAERGRAYRAWYRIALELERIYGPKERVFSVLGPNQSWTVQQFKKADLMGAIDVLIEDGSQTPKTSLGKRAGIEQLNQLGFLDRNDAEQRYNVLKSFGELELLPSLDNHVKSALQEQDAFERWATSPASAMIPTPTPVPAPLGSPGEGLTGPTPGMGAPAGPEAPPAGPEAAPPAPPPMMMAMMPQPATPPPLIVEYWHQDQIHNAEHTKWANTDAARQLFGSRPELKPLFTQHMQLHDLAAAKKAMMQAQIQAAAMPQPPGQGSQLAMERSNKESGNPADVPRGQRETPNQGPQ